MFKKNIFNTTDISNVLNSDNINIHKSFKIRNKLNNNIFSSKINEDTTINGNFIVEGEATFSSIVINEYNAGIVKLAENNQEDIIHLGMYGKYVEDGIIKYSGLIRDSNSKDWILFNNVETIVDNNVDIPNSSFYDKLKVNMIKVNNGSKTLPAINFNSNIDSGIYLENEEFQNFNISHNGEKKINFRKDTIEFTDSLHLPIGNNINPSINFNTIGTGIYSPNINILDFVIAEEKKLELNSEVTEFYTPLLLNSGSAEELSVTFTGTNNGLFHNNTRVGFAINNTNKVDITSDGMSIYDTLASSNGSELIPSVNFNNSNSGFYQPAIDQIGISISGENKLIIKDSDTSISNILQLSNGDLTTPSLYWEESNIGFYSNENSLTVSENNNQLFSLINSVNGSYFSMHGGFTRNLITFDGDTLTLNSNHNIIELTNSNPITITLPLLNLIKNGHEFLLICLGGDITINTSGGEFIDDDTTTIVLDQLFSRILLISGNSKWYTL